MNDKVNQLLENAKGKKVGIFIDNANWFYPQKELGWRVSFSKLLIFLQEYFQIKVVKIYAGTPLSDKDQPPFDHFCQAVQKSGCFVVTKPLKKIWLDRTKGVFVHKCNFDVEKKKRFLILCFEKGVAWEMRKLHHIFLEDLRNIIKR